METYKMNQQIVDNMPLAYALLAYSGEQDFEIIQTNQAFLNFFAKDFRSKVLGQKVKRLFKLFNMEQYNLYQTLKQTFHDGETHIKDIYLKNIERYFELKFNRLDPKHISVYMIDITEKMQVEQLKNEMEEQHAILRTALDATPDMVAIKNLDGRYVMVNEAVNKHYSPRFENIEGKTIDEVYPPKEIPKIKALDNEAIKAQKAIRKKVSVFTDDDNYVVSDITRSPIYNHENKLIGLISVGRDISKEEKTREELVHKHKELKRLSNKFKQLSYQDDLTRLPNRRKFYKDIKNLDSKIQYKLISLDLNNFKRVNDDFGHNFGDKTLSDYADFLDQLLTDYKGRVYRIGGDEFAVIVRAESKFSIENHITAINDFLATYHEKLTLAYGESILDKKAIYDDVYLDVNLKNADQRLYHHKHKQSKKNDD